MASGLVSSSGDCYPATLFEDPHTHTCTDAYFCRKPKRGKLTHFEHTESWTGVAESRRWRERFSSFVTLATMLEGDDSGSTDTCTACRPEASRRKSTLVDTITCSPDTRLSLKKCSSLMIPYCRMVFKCVTRPYLGSWFLQEQRQRKT